MLAFRPEPEVQLIRFILGIIALASAMAFGTRVGAQEAAPTRGLVAVSLPVALRDLARGDTIGPSDYTVVDTAIMWRWHAAPTDMMRSITGYIVRRAIRRGEVLRPPSIGLAPVVVSGARVDVIYQDGPVRLVVAGIATNTAMLGAPVGVRLDQNRRVDGVATGANTVRIR